MPSNKRISPARCAPTAALDVDIVCDDEARWRELGEAEAIVTAAADAVSAWPELLNGPSSVSIAFSSDAEVTTLNARFRGQAKPTNVLSFPAGAGSPDGFLGDIILARETVLREAAAQGTPPVHHVQHLVVHGILHLLGYDHETPADADRMEAVEIRILAKLGIANPYTGELDPVTKE